jgi:hypothetical protein
MVIIIAVTGINRVRLPRDILHDAFQLQLHPRQTIRPMLAQEL